MEEGDLKRRGVAAGSGGGDVEGSTSRSTSASIESARRFLYDEDELPAGNPANTPLPASTVMGGGGGGAFEPQQRLNPLSAACMATFATCRGFGLKRCGIFILVVVVLLFLGFGIAALVNGEMLNGKTKIQNRIIQMGLSTPQQLTTPGTPQHDALHWLTSVDKTRPGNPYLLQRYALAVFFYSNSLSNVPKNPKSGWRRQDNWMTKKGICIWHGVLCETSEEGPQFDGNGPVTTLSLPENNVQGIIPSELTALTELYTLDLSTNEIYGTLPTELSQLTELRSMILEENAIEGNIPNEYGGLGRLRDFVVRMNKLTGTVPTGVSRMMELRNLDLNFNRLTGAFPNLQSLEKLTSLKLAGNQFNSTFPFYLIQMSNLVTISIGSNKMFGTMPPQLDLLTKLEFLDFSSNKLNGRIPEGLFGKLTRLREVILFSNDLTGPIPTNLGSVKDITTLALSDNKFTGTIPRQLGLLVDMTRLALTSNKLTGTIPGVLSSMKDLITLKFNQNQLTGTIPWELGSMRALQEIMLEGNKLTGKIPSELGYLKELKNLRVYENNLTGTVPEQVCSLVTDEVLAFFGADCSSGAIACQCCQKCY